MKSASLKQKKKIQQKILSWYAKNKRDLPWRKTTDPYAILVSEIMLQQTQVDRVIPYYHRFLQRFPTIKKLAAADNKTLLQHWSGLGFNSRALRLKMLAQHVIDHFDGVVPDQEEELRSLPGIGPYTSRAIMAFAFNKTVPVVDTNIRRVLIYELGLSEDISLKELEPIALSAIPKGKSRMWHNALMDYGALHKTSRVTGIKPLSKQSTFKGSEREIRGKIVKHFLKHDKETLIKLKILFPHAHFKDIADKMIEDGIIKKEKDFIFFP